MRSSGSSPGGLLRFPVADVRDLVEEADAGGQKAICGVLEYLSLSATDDNQRSLVPDNRLVEGGHDRLRLFVFNTHADLIGYQEVTHSRARTKEVRV